MVENNKFTLTPNKDKCRRHKFGKAGPYYGVRVK
jgi:hypothetical protein